MVLFFKHNYNNELGSNREKRGDLEEKNIYTNYINYS